MSFVLKFNKQSNNQKQAQPTQGRQNSQDNEQILQNSNNTNQYQENKIEICQEQSLKRQCNSSVQLRCLQEERNERKLRNQSSNHNGSQNPINIGNSSFIDDSTASTTKFQHFFSKSPTVMMSSQSFTLKNNYMFGPLNSSTTHLKSPNAHQGKQRSLFNVRNLNANNEENQTSHISSGCEIPRRNINLDKYLSQSIQKDTRAEIDQKLKDQSLYFSKDLQERLKIINNIEKDMKDSKQRSNSRLSSQNRSLSAQKILNNSSLMFYQGIPKLFRQSPQASPRPLTTINIQDQAVNIVKSPTNHLEAINRSLYLTKNLPESNINQCRTSKQSDSHPIVFQSKSPQPMTVKYEQKVNMIKRCSPSLLKKSFFTQKSIQQISLEKLRQEHPNLSQNEINQGILNRSVESLNDSKQAIHQDLLTLKLIAIKEMILQNKQQSKDKNQLKSQERNHQNQSHSLRNSFNHTSVSNNTKVKQIQQVVLPQTSNVQQQQTRNAKDSPKRQKKTNQSYLNFTQSYRIDKSTRNFNKIKLDSNKTPLSPSRRGSKLKMTSKASNQNKTLWLGNQSPINQLPQNPQSTTSLSINTEKLKQFCQVNQSSSQLHISHQHSSQQNQNKVSSQNISQNIQSISSQKQSPRYQPAKSNFVKFCKPEAIIETPIPQSISTINSQAETQRLTLDQSSKRLNFQKNPSQQALLRLNTFIKLTRQQMFNNQTNQHH
ncbi:UNKNOWN [Stylonychia lemnae]|uniref:Uncharacterized protein n=1 Tax=Stylonychia lemnae TaxID=5949 RepID=A0A077ZW16_STYLE|nr:UNKNOWN [Stylonychia lemnae]|eukprot:CDW73781.1 UNKNOWN [Stylonychia lemnae]